MTAGAPWTLSPGPVGPLAGDRVSATEFVRYCGAPGPRRWVDSPAPHFHADAEFFHGVKGDQITWLF
jgi:hypothetical protein